MSIEGVNSKIMIHKATEFAREAGSQVKRAEVMQTHLQRQSDAEAKATAAQVNDVYEASEVLIQKENEKKRQAHRHAHKAKKEEAKKEETAEKTDGNMPSMEGLRKKIDIRI